jgi:hypothetical protein
MERDRTRTGLCGLGVNESTSPKGVARVRGVDEVRGMAGLSEIRRKLAFCRISTGVANTTIAA